MSDVLDCCVPVAALSLLFAAVCGLLSFAMGPTALVFCLAFVGLTAVCLGEFHVKNRAESLPLLVLMGVLTIVFAGLVGTLNWKSNYHLYKVTEAGRGYRDVSPERKALPYSDAGTITFSGATLDTMKSTGLSDGFHTYCVAPIMTPRQSATHGAGQYPVTFWAVGTDCCDGRQNFQCGDAGLPSVDGGVVVPQPHPETWLGFFHDTFGTASRWDLYAEAVEAAAAFHGLRSTETPVLIHWVEKPEDIKRAWRVASMLVFVISNVLHLALVSAGWMLACYYRARKAGDALDDGLGVGPLDGGKSTATSGRTDPFLLAVGRPHGGDRYDLV